jgi:hypothetical protein
MGRRTTGHAHTHRAQALVANTQDADALRVAQTILLPNLLGISVADTALAVGRSRSWVAHTRARFLRSEGEVEAGRAGRGGRRRALMSPAAEAVVVREAIVACNERWPERTSVRKELARLLWEKLDRPVAQSTVTAIMRRVAEVWFPGRGSAQILSNMSFRLYQDWITERRHKVRMF